jgi:hypothetical protein
MPIAGVQQATAAKLQAACRKEVAKLRQSIDGTKAFHRWAPHFIAIGEEFSIENYGSATASNVAWCWKKACTIQLGLSRKQVKSNWESRRNSL